MNTKQGDRVHKEGDGWSGEANLWLMRIFAVAAFFEFLACIFGFFITIFCIFFSGEATDIAIAVQGLIITVPETFFWIYGGWVWLKGTFGHSYLRKAAVFYVIFVMLAGLFMIAWLIMVMAGSLVFNGKGGLLGFIESFAQKNLFVILPFVLVIEFHKTIFLIYYIKYYYWDNKKKTDSRMNKNNSNKGLNNQKGNPSDAV